MSIIGRLWAWVVASATRPAELTIDELWARVDALGIDVLMVTRNGMGVQVHSTYEISPNHLRMMVAAAHKHVGRRLLEARKGRR